VEDEFELNEDNEDGVKKGFTKENLSKLKEPPKRRDWIIFVILILVLALAYFYWRDVSALKSAIAYYQNNCLCQ